MTTQTQTLTRPRRGRCRAGPHAAPPLGRPAGC